MDSAAHIAALRGAIADYVELLDGADLAAAVPTCPEWTLFDLAAHVGGLWHWAAHLLDGPVIVETWRGAIEITYPIPPGDNEEVLSFLGDGAERLLAACDRVDVNAPAWAWGADQHARFWPRRMLFETVVHRVDAEIARGFGARLDDDVAAEGIDEHLENLPATSRWGDAIDGLRGPRAELELIAPGKSWRVRLGPRGFVWDRGRAVTPDVLVTGSAGSLYLLLLGRLQTSDAATSVEGNVDLLARFLASTSF